MLEHGEGQQIVDVALHVRLEVLGGPRLEVLVVHGRRRIQHLAELGVLRGGDVHGAVDERHVEDLGDVHREVLRDVHLPPAVWHLEGRHLGLVGDAVVRHPCDAVRHEALRPSRDHLHQRVVPSIRRVAEGAGDDGRDDDGAQARQLLHREARAQLANGEGVQVVGLEPQGQLHVHGGPDLVLEDSVHSVQRSCRRSASSPTTGGQRHEGHDGKKRHGAVSKRGVTVWAPRCYLSAGGATPP
mmetsp:Transcript_66996/g.187272  ORF Transcript_66996/g.187272 Transcript_66996/m.187272 type:complete len:242 (+) Transcript_66996:130-855(+)